MDVVAELILVRHGESLANVALPAADAAESMDAQVYGPDAVVPLTPLGEEQARAVGRWLAERPPAEQPEIAFVSPYLRARETWRIAVTEADLWLPMPTIDERLVDRMMGDLELMTRAAVAARFPLEAARRARAGEYRYAPPNGESFADLEERLTDFLDDLNQSYAGHHVLVVAHDAVVLMMRAVIEKLDWDAVLATEREAGSVRNASISRFVAENGRLVLERYNAVDHL